MIKLIRFVKDELEFTAIEYGLIAAMTAIGIMATVTSVGFKLYTIYTTFNAFNITLH
ncbi:MAG: Flp family type IVb pilin [Candidatus Scalinduaceae bacterium]